MVSRYARSFLLSAFVVSIGGTTQVRADYTDGFEGPALDPFWSTVANGGTVQLSTDRAHSGVSSLKITSTQQFTSDVEVQHIFAPGTYGTLSVWFFDTDAGSYTTYKHILRAGSELGFRGEDNGINTQVVINSTFPAFPPRAAEWHYFEIQSLPGSLTEKIGVDDGHGGVADLTTVYSGTDSIPLGTLFMGSEAGIGSVPGTGYWDDFKVTVVPEPSALTGAAALLSIWWIVKFRRRGHDHKSIAA